MSQPLGAELLYETLRIIVRVLHITAASAWIGGSLFYALVLVPAFRAARPAPELSATVAQAFGRLVTACAWTLLASGMFMTFDRLREPTLGAPYAVVLGLKVLIAVWMFILAGALGRSRRRTRRKPVPQSRWAALVPVQWRVLVLGLVVFVLSAALTSMYQAR